MHSVRFLTCLILCAMLAVALTACDAPLTPSPAPDVKQASISRLCEQTVFDAAQAQEVLSLLSSLGYEGEVMFAYPAVDDDDVEYYHVWIGERTVDVYADEDGNVRSVRQSGVVLYGEQPTIPTVQQPSTEQPSTEQPPVEQPSTEQPTEQPPAEQAPTVAEPTQDGQETEMTLTVDEWSGSVTVGDKARITARGRAGERYRIEVHYKSGISSAKGLEPQVAGEDGALAWSWTVSARTTPGDYRIRLVRLSDERDCLELAFSVLPKK